MDNNCVYSAPSQAPPVTMHRPLFTAETHLRVVSGGRDTLTDGQRWLRPTYGWSDLVETHFRVVRGGGDPRSVTSVSQKSLQAAEFAVSDNNADI